jgi:hypothetical protein
MTKIIKEMLPPDVRVARDAQDLLIECCVGEKNYDLFLAFFFFLISQKNSIKKRRGAQPLVHWGYTKGLGRGREEKEKIRKANHPRSQPTHCPGEKGEKKKVEEFLNRSRGVLEASIVSLAPNTPHNT